jgi:predicted MFS family arabinose efflux permease
LIDREGITIPLTVMLAVQAIVSLVAVTVPVLAPVAASDIGISSTSVGVCVSLIYFSSMMSSLWSGDFILRYGALRVSQVCLVFCGIGLMLTAFASIPAMIVSALVIGLGYGSITPASSHILIRNTPAHMMSFVFSLKQTGVPLGGVIAGAIVPPLVISAGWKNASIIIGAFCISCILLINPIRSGIDSDRQPNRHISFRGVFRPLQMVVSHRPLLQVAVISFLYAGMQLCLLTYLVIYLTRDIGMAFIGAGLMLSAGQMAGTIGRIIWGILADRYLSPRLLLGILGVAMSLGAVATAFFSPAWPSSAILTVVILFGATAIGWNGVYLAETARLAPDGQVGAATGGTLFFTYLGVVLGPSVFAAVASGTDSYPMGYVFFAVLTFICGAVAILSRRKN